MIGKTLQNILNEKNVKVSELSRLIGVSDQTLYSIIKRDNMKIDFEVLLKICNALSVDVERFYSDYVMNEIKKSDTYTHQEQTIIEDFRKLNKEGRDYIVKTLEMAKQTYSNKKVTPSNQETSEEKEKKALKSMFARQNDPNKIEWAALGGKGVQSDTNDVTKETIDRIVNKHKKK